MDDLRQKWKQLLEKKVPEATANCIKDVTSKHLIWILIVFLLGLLLHEGRTLFYRYAPWIIKHSSDAALTFNVMSLDFYRQLLITKVILNGLHEALYVFSGGTQPKQGLAQLASIAEPILVSPRELRQVMKESTVVCDEINSGWATVAAYTRSQTSDVVCPWMRAVTPLGSFGQAINTIGSPFSYDPTPQANNCKPGDLDYNMCQICLVVNSGMVLLHVVLPIMLVIFVFRAYIRVLASTAWLSLLSAIALASNTVRAAANLLV